MTYQPKSYRKFLATSVAAAMVATVAAPAVFANETTEFTDVEGVSSWAGEAIDYLVAKGAIVGDGEGTFNPGGELTRAQAAKILAVTLDLTVDAEAKTDFADAEDHWASSYIKAIQDQKPGVIDGYTNGNFDPDGTISRQEMAKMTVKAYGLELDENAEVIFTDNTGWGKDDIQVLASLGIVEGYGELFKPEGEVTRAESVVFVHRTEVDSVRLDVEYTNPVVESVSATNLKEVVVAFNTELDKDTVLKANFKIDGSSLASADTVSLSEDGKSVTITLDTEFVNQTDFEVTVEGVKNLAGVAVEKTTIEATAFDVTVPSVVSAQQSGPSSIKVVFSEPIKTATAANFKIDGGTYFIDGASLNVDGNEVTFDLYTTIPVGEHTVTVSGVKDFADYSIVTTETTFVASDDDVAPTVSKIVKATPELVIIEFTEDISLAAGVDADDFYHTNTGNTVDASGYSVINGNQLKLVFGDNELPKGTAYLYIAKEMVLDGWNNKSAAIELVLDVAVDKTKPTLSKAESADDQTITLTFSEDVDPATAEVEANYTILDGNGEEVDTAFTATVDGDEVELDFAPSNLSGAIYTVVVEKVEDLSGNIIDKISASVSVTDSTSPEVADLVDGESVDGFLYGNKQIVKISFTEAMDSADLLNLSNYKLVGGKYLSEYKATASITDNGKAVLIDLSDEGTITLMSGNDIQVGKLHDTTGNAMENLSTSVNLADQDSVGINIDSVKAVGTKSIEVTLTDSLSTFEANDFSLEDESGNVLSAASVSFVNVDGKGVITFTLVNALDTDATVTSGDGLVVKTDATSANINSTNAFGVKVANDVTSSVATDKIAPDFATVAFTTADTIEIVFTEAIEASTLSRYTFTVAGNTVTGFSYDGVLMTATLTLKDDVASGNEVTVTQALEFEDVLGNKVTGLEDEVTR